MGLLSRWRVHKTVSEDFCVEVSERAGVRALHLGSRTVQSAMRLAAPDDLELPYTRSMMGFLLFRPDPRHVLMIGLGGGSLAKFVYRKMPDTKVVAVELSSQVVAAARTHFFLPSDDARLQVEIGDGGAYVATHPACADVLLVDAFDGVSLAPPLATGLFYADCRRALTENGILSVNLWGSDKRFNEYLACISSAFDGRVLCLPAERHGNIVVFAFARLSSPLRWDHLNARAGELERSYGLEFLRFVDALRGLNLHTDKHLLL